MSEKLKPATDLDSNVWYQLSELAVDDDDVDLKSMLQPTSPGGDLRVWDANKQSYWQFQKISDTPGRYQIRCSDTTLKKQLSICNRTSKEVIDEKKRTRPCLMPIDDTDAQKWDVAIWGSGEYRITNVDVGEGWNLDCIPSGPVFMSSNLEGEQLRQHWVMSSVGKVDDEMYSTLYTAPPSSTDATTATTGSDSTVPSTTSTDTSDSSNSESTGGSTSEASGSTGLSSGAIAGISVGATLGVVALALAAFFLWRRNKRKYHAAGTSDSIDKHDNSPIVVSPNTTYSGTYAGDKTHPPSEMAHEQAPQELSTGQHQRHELA
ncbi:hypothetical protein KAF25_002187 [Fusarium avenaceum]|uniref:Ricin B lectin domain-containing protein n=1 Tax=Fusarium avenaceum TaxID=40199 RepID=A0A9P7H4C3_9HYPO|nr:hypothetical protein KAF25_002187 [Fusarium avenaceum]